MSEEKINFEWQGEKYLYKLNEELDVIYKRDEFHTATGKLKTISFCSYGLLKLKQQELLLVLEYNQHSNSILKDDGEVDLSNVYVSQMFQFFEIVFKECKKNNIVTECGYSQVGSTETPFFGQFCGVLYSGNQSLPKGYTKLNIPSKDVLVMTLITEKELECYKIFGGSRVLTKLGQLNKWFPFPFWNDLGRKKDCVDIKESKMVDYIANIGHLAFPNVTVTLERKKTIRLQIPKAHATEISNRVTQLHFEKNSAILFRAQFNQSSDSHLYFNPSQACTAITTPAKRSDFLGASFVTFGVAKENSFTFIEDGFAIMLKEDDYKKMMEMLKDMKPFNVALSNGAFEVQWGGDAAIPKKDSVVTRIELGSPDEIFKAREVSVRHLAEYMKIVDEKSSLFFKTKHIIDDFSFVLHMKILKDSCDVEFQISKIDPASQKDNCFNYLVFISRILQTFKGCTEKGPEVNVNFVMNIKSNIDLDLELE